MVGIEVERISNRTDAWGHWARQLFGGNEYRTNTIGYDSRKADRQGERDDDGENVPSSSFMSDEENDDDVVTTNDTNDDTGKDVDDSDYDGREF
jgi:hypothetical protein